MPAVSALTAIYVGPGEWANAVIRRWQRSPASHCEMVTRRAGDLFECWSASKMDGGVRRKAMLLKPAHWELYRLPFKAEPVATWFHAHEGRAYDLLGLLGFAWRPWRGERNKWFCSEACAASVGMPEPWRFDPATWREMARAIGKRVPL